MSFRYFSKLADRVHFICHREHVINIDIEINYLRVHHMAGR
jgi:hypothetical protein